MIYMESVEFTDAEYCQSAVLRPGPGETWLINNLLVFAHTGGVNFTEYSCSLTMGNWDLVAEELVGQQIWGEMIDSRTTSLSDSMNANVLRDALGAPSLLMTENDWLTYWVGWGATPASGRVNIYAGYKLM